MTSGMSWWDRHPAGSEFSTAPRGTPAFFEEVARVRDATLPHVARFAGFAEWRDLRVLEIGCGMGCDGVRFVQAGAEYTGIDLSGTSLALMRTRLDQIGLDATLIHSDAADLAEHVRSASFDLVFAHDVLPYAADPEALIRQARRAVSGQGEFRASAQARHSWRHAMAEAGFAPADALPGAPEGRTTTAAEFRAALRAQDFAVTRIEQDHIFQRTDMQPESDVQPWFAAMPPAMLRSLERLAGWHLLAVARPG
jgi:SAM-dependent methyltransferase